MPLEIVELFESGDPLDEERKEHRRLVLEESMKDPQAFIEEHRISVVSADEGATAKVRLPLKKEYGFVYGDFSEKSGEEGVLSSDRPQLGEEGGGQRQKGGSGKEPLKRGEDIGRLLTKEPKEMSKGIFGTGDENGDSDAESVQKQVSPSNEQGQGAGHEKGDDLFETEVPIDDLSRRLAEKYRLPDLDRMDIGFLSARITSQPSGFRKKGPISQIVGRLSAEERLKRLHGEDEDAADIEDAPWHQQDLRYRRKKEDRRFITNAVVNFVRDASGSMDQKKLRLIRAFASHILRGIRKAHKDGRVIIRFFTFETEAAEWDEERFFYKTSSGGTKISSGIQKVLDESKGEFNPENYNHYTFFFTDGENQTDDREKVAPLFSRLCAFCKFVAYFEVFRVSYGSPYGGAALDEFYDLESKFDNIAICVIKSEEETETAFEHFLERCRELDKKKGGDYDTA